MIYIVIYIKVIYISNQPWMWPRSKFNSIQCGAGNRSKFNSMCVPEKFFPAVSPHISDVDVFWGDWMSALGGSLAAPMRVLLTAPARFGSTAYSAPAQEPRSQMRHEPRFGHHGCAQSSAFFWSCTDSDIREEFWEDVFCLKGSDTFLPLTNDLSISREFYCVPPSAARRKR